MIRNLPALPLALATLLTLALPLPAQAQSRGDAPPTELAQTNPREAGSSAHFRVIERFPGSDSLPPQIPSIAPTSPFAPIIEDVERNNWASAHRDLQNPELRPLLNDDASLRFLAATVAMEAGHPDQTRAILNELDPARDLPVLADYASLLKARAALATEDAHTATLAAAAIAPESLLYPDALILLAEALQKAGQPEDRQRAIEVLDLFLNAYPRHAQAAAAREQLATLLEATHPGRAAELYLNIRQQRPLSQAATRATRQLRTLDAHLTDAQRRLLDDTTPERALTLARARFDLHQSEHVISQLNTALERWPEDAPQRCEALYLIGRSHTKLRQHSAGTPVYNRILEHCADTEWELRALYLGGRGRWNAGDRRGALTLFERIWQTYADHSYADDAMYFAARILRSEDRPDEARDRLTAQLQRYPEGDMAKDAHWLLLREYFDRDDFQAVIDHVDNLDKTGEDDLYTKGRLHYFRARALLQAGRNDEAAQAFIKVTRDHPMSYYALLSFNQLARLQGSTEGLDICATVGPACEELLPANLQAAPVELPDELERDAGFQKASRLLTLGLTSLARRELTALRTRHANTPSTLWALASLLDAAHAYPISHDLARRHIHGWMDAYPTQTTRRHWSIAYPTPFKDTLTRYAEQRGLSPAIIYAIMREESGFNPRIESWANARGLLQLIEPTARRIAQRDGLEDFSFDLLFDPTLNIRLGSAYMRELASQTSAHPALIIAGYNGGFGNVSTWLKDFGNEDLDLFVENIPYGQTRDYTKRVLMSFWIYSYLYGDARVPTLSFTLPPP
ncbi:tetratricopeptide repeat protein [Lujinxingia sediminis]|uniref:Tetratricopeptide repeat protein n=1 Tax=Lujinxingia sediminis TaxID=2480984 RepID=A0ABY0CV98_9DELT|nr:transglycosylase SLT domain-containing protein [Lujinxingia sediminis]RVU46992.1 tetratricopeptide repeat protein [Lujinxingia sediminis]